MCYWVAGALKSVEMDSVFPTLSISTYSQSAPSINNQCNLDTQSLLSVFHSQDSRLFYFIFSFTSNHHIFARLGGLTLARGSPWICDIFHTVNFPPLHSRCSFFTVAALDVRIVYYVSHRQIRQVYSDKSLISSTLDCWVRISDLKSSSMFADT